MNKREIDQYKMLLNFLGDLLGKNHEIVLHNIEKNNYHIAAIINNHITNRTIDSPITEFALSLIKEKVYLEHDYITNYKVKTSKGIELIGSTFFIKDKNELKGMICVNSDYSKYEFIANEVIRLIPSNLYDNEVNMHNETSTKYDINNNIVEVLSGDIREIIYELIDPNLLNDKVMLNQETKLDIVRKLESKGVFQVKGAVTAFAETLKISEASVYRYLKMIKCWSF